MTEQSWSDRLALESEREEAMVSLADFEIRQCEDCGEEMMDNERRMRCKKPTCGKLVCRWCYHHVHQVDLLLHKNYGGIK